VALVAITKQTLSNLFFYFDTYAKYSLVKENKSTSLFLHISDEEKMFYDTVTYRPVSATASWSAASSSLQSSFSKSNVTE
jgi:hypothetical protein